MNEQEKAEYLATLPTLNLREAEFLAKAWSTYENLGKKIVFDLCGPTGSKPAYWLDPYMGLFVIDGLGAFSMVSQFDGYDGYGVYVTNMRLEDDDG